MIRRTLLKIGGVLGAQVKRIERHLDIHDTI
jgi:hypothetical protein